MSVFVEIINTPATTTTWAEVKPVGTFPSCGIAIKPADGSSVKLSMTGVDADPHLTLLAGAGITLGPLRLDAGVRIIYVQSIDTDCTVETVIERN